MGPGTNIKQCKNNIKIKTWYNINICIVFLFK